MLFGAGVHVFFSTAAHHFEANLVHRRLRATLICPRTQDAFITLAFHIQDVGVGY